MPIPWKGGRKHEYVQYSQVDELEGELPQPKVQLSQVKRERDSLVKQLDAMSTKLANLESQFSREKTSSATLQVNLLLNYCTCNSLTDIKVCIH